MNEITKIHLGRQPFTVSVEAYRVLQSYLSAITHQLDGKSADVMKEVETRMAELLTERGITPEKVVLLEDVDYLKEQLGSPKDFTDDKTDRSDAPDERHEPPAGPKRLFRDAEHGMVAGVSSGLANYLGIDAIFIRVLFIIAAITGGWGLLIYIIMWLLVPEAKTTSDVLQMQGKPVTVRSLKKIVERADVPGAARRAKTTAGGIIEVCAKVLLWVVGMAIAVAGALSLLALISASIYVAIRGRVVFQEELFPVGGAEMLLIGLSLLASAIFALFLVLIGIAMIRRKWQLPGWAVASLVGIFFVSVAVGSAMLPDVIPKVRDRYNEAHHSTIRKVDDFSQLQLDGDGATDFSYVPDSAYFVEMRYLGDIDTAALKTVVDDHVLKVDARGLGEQARCKTICLVSDRVVQVILHGPDLTRVAIRGDGTSFAVKTPLPQNELILETDRKAAVRLSHLYPAMLSLSNQSSESNMTVRLAGLRPGALDNDVLNIWRNNVQITRAEEVRLQTDQTCQSWEPFVSVVAPPSRIFMNDTAKPVGEVTDQYDQGRANLSNCLYVEGQPRPEGQSYYHR